MKHKTIDDKTYVGGITWRFKVQIIPENDIEAKAIQNVEENSATDIERDLVENYLLFALSEHSIINCKSQGNGIFIIETAK